MVDFTCSRCGRCCQNFGPYLCIERELEEGHYYCRCVLTGEYFFAREVAGAEKEISRNETASKGTNPCPFLCREPTGRYTCTIYPSRPAFCRGYRCTSMDIQDSMGRHLGKVGGRRSLISTDPSLSTLWREEIHPLSETDDPSWREKVRRILERNGYQVVLYD